MPTNDMPVVFLNPFNGKLDLMPVEMVNAYAPYTGLSLEGAARVAAIRDDEAATNLLLSVILDEHESEYAQVITPPEFSEGTAHDVLSVEPPALR